MKRPSQLPLIQWIICRRSILRQKTNITNTDERKGKRDEFRKRCQIKSTTAYT